MNIDDDPLNIVSEIMKYVWPSGFHHLTCNFNPKIHPDEKTTYIFNYGIER